jgi:hypothetical protein
MNPSKPTILEWNVCRRYTSQEMTKLHEYLYNTKLSKTVPAGAIRFYPPLPARQPLSLVFIRAGFIKRTLGTRVAAGYLRNRSVSIETALYLLTRKGN